MQLVRKTTFNSSAVNVRENAFGVPKTEWLTALSCPRALNAGMREISLTEGKQKVNKDAKIKADYFTPYLITNWYDKKKQKLQAYRQYGISI